MKEFKVLEIVSLEQARQVALLDAPKMSTRKNYPETNQLSYYLVINCWLYLWRNFARHAWVRLLGQICSRGLIPLIAEMQTEADRIIRDEDFGPWARILFSEVRSGNPVTDANLYSDMIGENDTATVLFLLRFPKRFSPSDNDIVQKETLKDFVQYENRTKLLQRTETYAYTRIVERVRDVISRMYDWDRIVEEIDNIDPLRDYRFSGGAALDASATLGDKVLAIVRDGNEVSYIQPIFGVYTLDRIHDREVKPHASKIVAVPKSYKASRIIAMEPTAILARGLAIEHIFRNIDRRTGVINLEDQSINQRLAQYGSETGLCATLDASHASDLISKSLFVDVFPRQYVARVLPSLPAYCIVNGVKRPLHMASTSGHTLTFRHETIVYKAIAQAAVECCLDLGISVEKPIYWAYGDDTIVSTEAYDIAVYYFQRLGLIINEDKSFADGEYRESCGEDYLGGMPVTSIYFPRFPILGKVKGDKVTLSTTTYRDTYRGKLENSLTMLIDLQKKLFPYSYDAARFLASIVQTAYPSVTTSVAGSVCTDLWDYVDSGKSKVPRAFEIEVFGDRFPKQKRFTLIGDAEAALSGRSLSVFRRLSSLDKVHTYPVVTYDSKKEFSDEEIRVYQYWKYENFLMHGPRFDDPLLELLGISQKPMSISEFFGKSRLGLAKK